MFYFHLANKIYSVLLLSLSHLHHHHHHHH